MKKEELTQPGMEQEPIYTEEELRDMYRQGKKAERNRIREAVQELYNNDERTDGCVKLRAVLDLLKD